MADYSPFDYFGQFVAPLQRDRQLDIQQQQVDAEEAQRRAQAAQLQAKAQEMAAYKQDAQSVISNPTPEGFRALLLKYPGMHESLKQSWDQYSEGQKERNVEAASQVYSALNSGRYDLALKLLQDRKDALVKSGESTDVTDSLIDMVKSGDQAKIKQAQGIAGFALAQATGPEKIGSTLEALSNYGGTGERKGQVVGRAIGHYDESGKWVVDYRDPDAPQYRELDVVGPDGQTHKAIVRVGGDGQPTQQGGGQGGFGPAVATVLKNEGSAYVPKDMNGKPVKFGINQGANPGVDVKNLTKDQAIQIYHDKYWVPSGAENLPGNLQTPYFDVYIRNPAIAKKALAQSGGDPQRFVQISSSYFQNLAKKPSGQPYAKAWANRDANNMAIATGGAPGQPSVGQPNIVALGASTADADGGLDPSTTSYYAQQILAGGTMPTLGMGKAAAAARLEIMKEVARQAGAEGLTGADLARQIAHYQAGKKRVATLENQLGTIQANEQTALANGQQYLDRSSELSAQTRFPIVNSVTQSYLRHTGDPTIAAMDAAFNTFASEYAKVVSGSPSGAGTLTDSARHEAMSIMQGNYTLAQKQKAFAQMKADMSNRIAAINKSISDSYSSLTQRPGASGGGSATRIRSVQEYNKLPSGAHYIDPNGVQRVKR
jgi:hypothetical protein